MSAATQQSDDLESLRRLLTAELERLAQTLLGQPTKGLSTKKTLRFGKNGSLALELRGRKRGEWFSHETGTGGGVFDLVAHAHGCRFPEAVRWARTWIGAQADAPRPRPRPVPAQSDRDLEEAAEDARAIESARQMAHAAEPLAGTIGETYLTATRGIPTPAAWPDAVRYHVASRSLLAIATLADGSVQAVQRVRLTPAAQKAEHTPENPSKRTHGRQAGAVVRLPARPDAAADLAPVLLLAEGPENGLSVWAATGAETWFAFGVSNFSKISLPKNRRVILCRDDDRQHSQADKSVRKAVTEWRKAGADVVVAGPWPERRGDKSDFNDLIRQLGASGVLARILPHAPIAPPQPKGRVPIETAREQVDAAVREFFKVAAEFDFAMAKAEGVRPPVHAVKVGVGIGKSHAARHYAIELLAKLRASGIRRNIALAVPTHRLGTEQAAMLQASPAFRKGRFTVRTWRGRTAPNPDHPDYLNSDVPDDEKAMCQNLEAVFDAQDHGLPVEESACRRKVKTGDSEKIVHECPLFSQCPYQAQKKQTADLWLVPHELLFTEKPRALGELAAVVVDESAWPAGLDGVTGRGIRMPLDALRGGDRRPAETRSVDWHVLQHHRDRAIDALDGMTDGPVLREGIMAEGLTAADAAEARALEWKRLVDPKIHPAMSRSERKAALQAAEGNRTAMQAVKFWRAMQELLSDGGPAASGWAEMATAETPAGPARILRLRGRKPVREAWQVPTLLIDALLDMQLATPFWPQARLTADVQASTPHQHVRQVIDRAYSKSRLEPLDDDRAAADPEEARRRVRNQREARAILCHEARRHGTGRVLVVAQKTVREALAALGSLPSNIVLAHHNAVAGRDEWGDVAGLVVIGRTAAPPADVERMAMALTGAAVTPLGGWYHPKPADRELSDGSTMAGEVDHHPDPICEAIRWQICEGELVQIIGRGRGVNRTAANPLDVLVMTDCPLPLPIRQAVAAADLDPSQADRMLAECGFFFENPGHAAFACPTLWDTRNAAKKAMEREAARRGKLGPNPYYNIFIGVWPQLPLRLRRVDYRRKGQGQGDATAYFDPLMITDPEAALTRLLGELAWCTIAPAAPSDTRPPDGGLSVAADGGIAPILPDPPEPTTTEPLMNTPAIRVPIAALIGQRPVDGLWSIRRRSTAIVESGQIIRFALPERDRETFADPPIARVVPLRRLVEVRP